MANDIFLDLGDIKGESQDLTHKDEITVLAWNWRLTNGGNFHVHTGGGSVGKGDVHGLTITKYIDKSSASLMQYLIEGKPIPLGTLTDRRPAGSSPLEWWVMKLTNIYVTSWRPEEQQVDGMYTEKINLNFMQVALTIKPQSATGSASGSSLFNWTAPKNAAA